MILLTLDPGIDQTGVAVFDSARLRQPARELLACRDALLGIALLRTAPTPPVTERLADLARQLRVVIVEAGARLVLIERPAIPGTYGRNRRKAGTADGFMPRTLQVFSFAVGALVATAADAGCRVEFVTAPRLGKAERAMAVRAVWPALGRTNEDQRDALYLGLTALTNPTRRWAA